MNDVADEIIAMNKTIIFVDSEDADSLHNEKIPPVKDFTPTSTRRVNNASQPLCLSHLSSIIRYLLLTQLFSFLIKYT